MTSTTGLRERVRKAMSAAYFPGRDEPYETLAEVDKFLAALPSPNGREQVSEGREAMISAMSVELEKSGLFDATKSLVWATRLYGAALSAAKPDAGSEPVAHLVFVAFPPDGGAARYEVAEPDEDNAFAVYAAPPIAQREIIEAQGALKKIQAHAAIGEQSPHEMTPETRKLFTGIVEFAIQARAALAALGAQP
jgi:hypothetical protein